MIRFWELTRCAGVDEDATPFPGMVVPLGGSNIVVLNTDGKDLQVDPNHGGIRLEEFDATDLRKKLVDLNGELSQPGVDSQYRDAMMPPSLSGYEKPRFFKIHAKKYAVGFPGARVLAKSGRKTEATLQVVVLDTMTVKVAIRNVKVRDAQGSVVFHAKKPVDPAKERDGMNAVWTPQTNMTFELVPSEPAFIDDRDNATKAELAKAFGLKDASTAVFPPVVDPLKMKDIFGKFRVRDADLTIFVIDKLTNASTGRTLPLGMSFIIGNHGPTTFAHEAGHFLGGSVVNGVWQDQGETYDKDRHKDIRMLMRDGGAGWKIPFKMTELFRGYFDRHKLLKSA